MNNKKLSTHVMVPSKSKRASFLLFIFSVNGYLMERGLGGQFDAGKIDRIVVEILKYKFESI